VDAAFDDFLAKVALPAPPAMPFRAANAGLP
jgi:hypothetical protein